MLEILDFVGAHPGATGRGRVDVERAWVRSYRVHRNFCTALLLHAEGMPQVRLVA